MKIQIANPKRVKPGDASVLLITLFLAIIAGLTLGSFLPMVRAQHASAARSQAWNASLLLAEAGAEEALAHLTPGVTPSGADRSADGWGTPSGGLYGPISRTL